MKFELLFAFVFFSVLGWFLEVFYRSIRNRRFVNPGLLKGPYLVLYGTAALILTECVYLFHESNFFIKILVYFFVTTGLELISGFIGECFFPHMRLWDYSEERFQFRGHVCLKFSFYWVVLAFIFEYIIIPYFQIFINWLPVVIMQIIAIICFFMIVIDFICLIKKRGAVKDDK